MQINTKQYIAQLKKHQQTILDSAAKIINATIVDMFDRIVERTPVGNPSLWSYPAPKGYNPGTLKVSWGITYNTKGSIRDNSGRFTSLQDGGIKFKVDDSSTKGATIYNNQPHAQRVEAGWSTQAPSGMMRITVAEYTILIDSNTARYRIK